jgi:nitroreductase
MPSDPTTDLAELTLALIRSRHSVAPKRLSAPGPSAAQLQAVIEAAACAPDHHGLRPWRLVQIGDAQRDALADVFEACTRDRLAAGVPPPEPTPADITRAREKAYRAPTLLLAVLCLGADDPEVPATERTLTLGAALMNLLLAAHGQGFAAMLTSGHAVRSARFARAFALAPQEQAVCFISIGTALAKAKVRNPRASAHEVVSAWQPRPSAD